MDENIGILKLVESKIIPTSHLEIPGHWKEFISMAEEYIDSDKAESTKECYKNDFNLFINWCKSISAPYLPTAPEIVTMYISHIAGAGKKVSTIERRLAAIAYHHDEMGYASPVNAKCVKAALGGIRKRKGCSPTPKAAARVKHVVEMINHCPSTISGIQDAALIAISLCTASRGSEPLSLDIEDLIEVPDGYVINLKRSKTDQDGKGKKKAIINGNHIRCVDLLKEWIKQLEEADIITGPLFRPVLKNGTIETNNDRYRLGYRSFYNRIKDYALKAGLNPKLFTPHSLRRGFVSEGCDNGAEVHHIMEVTDHKKYETVLGYKEIENLFKNHPGRLFL